MCAEPAPIDYSGATTGVGIKLQFLADAAGSTLQTVAGVLSADTPPRATTNATFTPLDDGVERVKQGKHESASVNMSLVYTAAMQAAIEALYRVMGTWNLLLPDGTAKVIAHGYMGSTHITNVGADNVITADSTFYFDGNRQFQPGT